MDRIRAAFAHIHRTDFLPEDMRGEASWDVPVRIGFGQTNSQPTTVVVMLEWLEAEPGDKVLDVGSGSGWTTALLSYIVGSKGKVFAVEIVPELLAFGRQNAERAGVANAQFFLASKTPGLARYAPYDRILVSASATELPQALVRQLGEGGKMVIPVGDTILEITKLANGKLDIRPHPGFAFVPIQ